jgi:imidazolonepropionase-like amidohydrolase
MKLASILLLATLVGAQSKPAPPASLIFTNVNVVNVRDGRVEPHMTVAIQNGLIVAVASIGLIGEAHNSQVINADGKYMIPGLWDMHVHSAFTAPIWDEKIIYPLYVANGVTGVRDMGGDFELLKQRRARIEKGDLLGPHLFIAGPFLVDAKPDAQTIAVKTPQDARAAVDKVKSEGADFVKILSRLSRESYFAIADEAKKDHIRFVGHVPIAVSAAEASAAGQYSIEHLTGISLACSSQEAELRAKLQAADSNHDWAANSLLHEQAASTYDPKKATALFSTFVDNNTWQVPTLIWTRTQSTLDAPNWPTDLRLKYVPLSVRQEWNPKQLMDQMSPDIFADYKNETTRGPQLVKAMLQVGVHFMAGSDGPDPYVFPGSSLHDELELLVQSGFTPVQALQAATINPALFMVKLDKYGVVENGHVADLVLLDANPLEDIRNTRKIAAVVLAGKYYSREDLDKMLSQVEALAK